MGFHGINNGICTANGCDIQAKTRGLCSAHYERWRDGRDFDAPVRRRVRHQPDRTGTKVCRKCHVEKSRYEYSALAKAADGLRPRCKTCQQAENRHYRSPPSERPQEGIVPGLQRWLSRPAP